MRRIGRFGTGLLLAALMTGACLAEDAVPPKFYKLNFVVKEVDGAKVVNTRSYSTMVSTQKGGQACSIRTGAQVPYITGKEYRDLFVGVNIDCRALTEEANGLSLWVDADISSVAESTTNTERPFVRQNKWGSTVLVPLKKPTLIFSSDDVTSKHQMQLELTATPIT